MELRGHLTRHKWGKIGVESVAAKLYWNIIETSNIPEKEHFSELLIGAYSRVTCDILEDERDLDKYIKYNPHVLGRCIDLFSGNLPFVINVMSVRTNLPLKMNPDKGRMLSTSKYKPAKKSDDYYKPFMLIALTSCEILCGMRPLDEMIAFFLFVPEMRIIIQRQTLEEFIMKRKMSYLGIIIADWLKCSPTKMKQAINTFFERTSNRQEEEHVPAEIINVMKKLHEHHPYNHGVFAPFFFNYFTLYPNETIFVKCGTPYCIISGDMIECSTCSNNEVLLALGHDGPIAIAYGRDMMDYSPVYPDEFLMDGIVKNDLVTSFIPPVPDFALDRVQIQPKQFCTLAERDNCSVFVITKGRVKCFVRPSSEGLKEFKMGSIVFMKPNKKLILEAEALTILYHFYPNI